MACDSGRCESCRPLRLKAPPTSPAAIYASYPSGLLKLRERRIRRTKRCTFLGLHEAWRSVMATIDTVVGQAGPVSCCQTLSARIELQVMFNSACCAFNYELCVFSIYLMPFFSCSFLSRRSRCLIFARPS